LFVCFLVSVFVLSQSHTASSQQQLQPSAASWDSDSAPWQHRIQQLQQQVQQHLEQRKQDIEQQPAAQPTPLFPMAQQKKVPPANGRGLQDQGNGKRGGGSPPEDHYANSKRGDYQGE